MDYEKIISHLCAFGVLVIGASCVWLGVWLFHAVKQSRRLKKQLKGKDKLSFDEQEIYR